MDIVISILLGVGRAVGTFALIMGAALIFDYGDKQARAGEHKKYQSIMLLITALACLFPAYEMYDGVLAELHGVEKVSFIIAAILCIITFISFFLSMASREK